MQTVCKDVLRHTNHQYYSVLTPILQCVINNTTVCYHKYYSMLSPIIQCVITNTKMCYPQHCSVLSSILQCVIMNTTSVLCVNTNHVIMNTTVCQHQYCSMLSSIIQCVITNITVCYQQCGYYFIDSHLAVCYQAHCWPHCKICKECNFVQDSVYVIHITGSGGTNYWQLW